MLTKKEVRKIKTYGVLMKLAIPFLVMGFVPTLIWGLFSFIDDFVLNSRSFYDLGLFLSLGITVLYIFGFGYSVLRVRFGTSRKSWRELVSGKPIAEKDMSEHNSDLAIALGTMSAGRLMKNSSNETISSLGGVTEVIGAIDTIDVAMAQVSTMEKNVKLVADYYHVDIPSAKKWSWLIILLPFVVMTLVYTPRFVESSKAKQERIVVVQNALDKVESTLRTYFENMSVDNLDMGLSDSYTVTGRSEDENSFYLSVEMDKSGTVRKLYYYMEILDVKSKEGNIEMFNSYIQPLSKLLTDNDINMENSEIAKLNKIPDEMAKSYLNSSDTEDMFVSGEVDSLYCTFSYNVEDVSEDSLPYFYFTIRNR